MSQQFFLDVRDLAELYGLECENDGYRTLRLTRHDGEFANVYYIDPDNPDDVVWTGKRYARSGWAWVSTVADGTSAKDINPRSINRLEGIVRKFASGEEV